MVEHIIKSFDVELKQLRSQVMEMGSLAQDQFRKVIDSLGTSPSKAYLEDIILADRLINQKEKNVDDTCARLIIKYQPNSSDLRAVLSALRVVTDLERIGDETKKIAKKIKKIPEKSRSCLKELNIVAAQTDSLFSSSLTSFVELDISSMPDLLREDKGINTAYKSIRNNLIKKMRKNELPIDEALNVIFIAKSIERIGDHSKNILEHVAYIRSGVDIRHQDIEYTEKEVQSFL